MLGLSYLVFKFNLNLDNEVLGTLVPFGTCEVLMQNSEIAQWHRAGFAIARS